MFFLFLAILAVCITALVLAIRETNRVGRLEDEWAGHAKAGTCYGECDSHGV